MGKSHGPESQSSHLPQETRLQLTLEDLIMGLFEYLGRDEISNEIIMGYIVQLIAGMPSSKIKPVDYAKYELIVRNVLARLVIKNKLDSRTNNFGEVLYKKKELKLQD